MKKPKISTFALEGEYLASKWLKIQALVDPNELSILMDMLKDFEIYPLSNACLIDEMPMSRKNYLENYKNWIEKIQNGACPTDLDFKPLNATAWTKTADAIWLQEIPKNRFLVKPCAPLIQVQVHHMSYSSVDGMFRSMILSNDRIFWGLQFSYPQIYQDPKTMEILEAKGSPNYELFQIIRNWSRDYTVATPMIVNQERKNLPIRLGKKCFSWVNAHPQLKPHSVLELNL